MATSQNSKAQPIIITRSDDMWIEAIKAEKSSDKKNSKKRLYLDVDGTLIAMIFNPDFASATSWPYKEAIYRTDFCHWINSVSGVLDKFCEVFVLTNFSIEAEKVAKTEWLKDNLKCNYRLILNQEGITKSLFVTDSSDILVDDTFRNLAEWAKAGGTQFAYQFVTCEKGRRDLLNSILDIK